MRFLVLSDIHGRARVAEWANRLADDHHAEAFLLLGDITHFGPASFAGEFIPLLKKPSFAIPGNCDPPELVCQEIEKHATLLHKRKVMIEGVSMVGLGGSNPTIFETPFEMDEEEIMSSLRPLMEPGAVMVVHAPPKGFNDKILTGLHVGSESLLKLVDEYHPRAVVSGHIHEARGLVEKNGTIFMNPGAAKDGFSGLLDVGSHVHAQMLEKHEG
jgi:Icc-related predicted phosphoesterase